MVIYKHNLTEALSVVSTLTYQSFVNKIYFVRYSYFNTKMLCTALFTAQVFTICSVFIFLNIFETL